jgi:hypothetical protein
MHAIPRGEARHLPCLMLVDSADEIARDADIQVPPMVLARMYTQ